METTVVAETKKSQAQKIVEFIIFSTKWLLIPFYIRLIWSLVVLLYHYFPDAHVNNEHLMEALEAVDICMIANLVKMVVTGSYNSSVDKTHGRAGENVSSGLLKVKMSTSIMGVSSIHLLQSFIDAENVSMETIYKQLMIHGIFILGAYFLAQIDYTHEKSESLTNSHDK